MSESKEDNLFDAEGYRFNVGIILLHPEGQKAFWGKRCGHDSWQFPQGGLQAGESDEAAAYRELAEETGLQAQDVRLLAKSKTWLKYRLPLRFRRPRKRGFIQCVGQKQRWFLMQLTAAESAINLNAHSPPEFERWCWYDCWQAANEVVHFKRKVYRQALEEFAYHDSKVIKKCP